MVRWLPIRAASRRIRCRKNNKMISGREPDEVFTTCATQGIGGLGRVGRHRGAVGRARAGRRIHLQIRQQSSRCPSDERPRQGDGGGDQDRDQRPLRSADFPQQPARLRHRHVEPNPLRRHRILHAVGPDPGNPGSGGFDQRHRLRVPGLRHGLAGHGRRSRRPHPRRDCQGPSGCHGQDLGQRVPGSPLWTSMFKAFDAAPASINFSEVYSALQTRIVEGQENPLAIISTAKLYEVQKFCSLTNHMWDGFWFLANRRAWEKLPEDLRTIVAKNINAAGVNERADVAKLNAGLRQELAGKGLTFNQPEIAPFREKLRSAGFYSEWKGKYGDEAWALLEKSVGKLS